jgi:hypothetical protein
MMTVIEEEVERRLVEKRLEMDAEVERRCAEQRAHLAREVLIMSGKRSELDSLLEKLTERLSDSDTRSVSSGGGGGGAIYTKPTGAPSTQLNFLFNGLRPRKHGVMWPVLRAAYNTDPARFEMGEGHVSAADSTPHQTIYYKCPVEKHDGTTGEYVIKIHVHYTEPPGGSRKYNRVWAQTLANSTVPQEIANFS